MEIPILKVYVLSDNCKDIVGIYASDEGAKKAYEHIVSFSTKSIPLNPSRFLQSTLPGTGVKFFLIRELEVLE